MPSTSTKTHHSKIGTKSLLNGNSSHGLSALYQTLPPLKTGRTNLPPGHRKEERRSKLVGMHWHMYSDEVAALAMTQFVSCARDGNGYPPSLWLSRAIPWLTPAQYEWTARPGAQIHHPLKNQLLQTSLLFNPVIHFQLFFPHLGFFPTFAG